MENDDRLLRKELKYYDTAVFDYLKHNQNCHIPVILDYHEEDGVLIVTEERIDGVTLDKYLEDKTPNRKEKVKLIEDLCDGLIFLHNAPVPIIHRDIKANNIMIDKEGVLKIIDYDAAKTYKTGESRDTVLIGTAGAAAPEQYGFAQSDPRTDVYAVGMLMQELFAGDHIYDSVINKATKLDPKQRYQTIKALKAALKLEIGKDYDNFRKPLIIAASAFAAGIVCLWGFWFIKYGRTVDENGRVIVVNPINQIMDDLTVSETENVHEYIEYDGKIYPYSDELMESLTNEAGDGTDHSGVSAQLVRDVDVINKVSTGTPTPSPTATPTPVPDYSAVLDEMATRSIVFFYSREQLVTLLMEEQHIDRRTAERAVDAKNYDYTDRAYRAASYRNSPDRPAEDTLTPRQMKPYLLSIGFKESELSRALAVENSNMDYYNPQMYYIIRRAAEDHTYSTMSALFEALSREGYTNRSYIDYNLNIGWITREKLKNAVRAGYIVDDINYFGLAPASQTTTAPTSPTTPTSPTSAETTLAPAAPSTEPTSATVPETEATTVPAPAPDDTQGE